MCWNIRHRLSSCRAVLCLLVVLAAASAFATEFRLIDDFRDVETIVDGYAAEFDPQHVLLVMDIDNTLLAMDEPLGSEQWFDWQVYLLKNVPNSPDLVADSFPGILDVQGRLYNHARMHPPQPDMPSILSNLQDRGVSAVVLTSRGDDFRAATERELVRNGFDFTRTPLATRDRADSLYMPYDPDRPDAAGISAREISILKLDSPQAVSYADGIMMTSGQHKGIMLVTLLHRAKHRVDAVVFVDNRADHVAGVYDQMLKEGLEVAGLVYQREDKSIKAFMYANKEAVSSQWRKTNRAAEPPTEKVEISVVTPCRSRVFRRCQMCR
jgi:hypothetical protein